ncbi:Uncharacterised protein [Burkholderia cenocepacia]|nr:Uncharacterised protein [Burkholderia cenocepacia]
MDIAGDEVLFTFSLAVQRCKRAARRLDNCLRTCRSGDVTKMFDAIEKAFDDVPSSIQYTAISTLGPLGRARRNNGLCTRGANDVHEGIRVIAFVHNYGAHALMLDRISAYRKYQKPVRRWRSFAEVGRFHRQPDEAWPSVHRVNGRAPVVRFLRASAECWWVRTMVESISRRLSSDRICHAFPTHLCDALARSACYTVCQRPNSFSKSRHGQPVRPIQRTVSTDQQLSAIARTRIAFPAR